MAVFSGAGISGEAPASLPRGFGLRDDLLRVMHGAAVESLPSVVTEHQLTELLGSARKLEVVLGRLSGFVGLDAARCLLSLRLELPNEAHMLAALLLARGAPHVTLNFDVGIELAYELLTGDRDVPETYREPLDRWRERLPRAAPSLRVVASHDEFDRWVAEGRPPALLKIHGSLSADQDRLVDVVVLDFDEIGQLTPGRRAAVDLLGSARELLITGYSGDDPDVYDPLLAAAGSAGSAAAWRCYSLAPTSPVPADATTHGIELVTGAPGGLATTALRELLADPGLPAWPEVDLGGPGYRERFDAWAEDLRRNTPADRIATAWAWRLADGGDLDFAERMLAALTQRATAGPDTLFRHAEILYTRARDDDRDRAGRLFRQLTGDGTTPDAMLLSCRLRLADISRGRLTRGRGVDRLGDAVRAYGQPLAVLATTRLGRREQESAADAYRALQQTSLRILEAVARTAPSRTWPALGQLCRAAAWPGRPAERLSRNGNRRGLVRQHRMLLAAYSCLLRGRRPPDGLVEQVRSLRNAYRSTDDLPGAGNLTVTLAVLAAAGDNPASTQPLLEEAAGYYGIGEPGRQPSASGRALFLSAGTIIQRASDPPGQLPAPHSGDSTQPIEDSDGSAIFHRPEIGSGDVSKPVGTNHISLGGPSSPDPLP